MAKVNFNVDVASKGVSGNIVKAGKTLKVFSKLASRKSIMTMAQPGLYQYPIVASSAIDTDVLMTIAKAYQLTYASSVAIAYSLNPIMYLNDTPEISEFIRKFHQNDDSIALKDMNIDGTVRGINNTINGVGNFVSGMLESATVVNDKYSKIDLEALSASAWDNAEDKVAMESLNNMYRPYDRTYRIMTEKVKTMKATEALSDKLDAIGGVTDDIDRNINKNNPNYSSTNINSSKEVRSTNKRTNKTVTSKALNRTLKNEVVKNSQLEAMEPTMVNVNILIHGEDAQKNRHGSYTQTITLGVKAMPRVISSDLMIASMVEACKETNAIFRFLKWTKGEIKTLDFVLGYSAAKAKALKENAKQEVKFLEQSKKRKRIGNIGKCINNEKLPTMSVVITSYEAAKIKEACNVDLNDIKEAVKLMNKYYLLSFAIYDTEQDIIKILFDCDTSWGIQKINVMKSLTNKATNVLNQNEILRVTGRA